MAHQPAPNRYRYPWHALYLAALLETDKALLADRIKVAEEELIARESVLTTNMWDAVELSAIEDALHALEVLRRNWLEQAA